MPQRVQTVLAAHQGLFVFARADVAFRIQHGDTQASRNLDREEDTSGNVPLFVGEKNPAITLQSETNNGSAAYAGITQIELELTGTPA